MDLKRPSLLVIFLTVFIDLVGFGIVLPLIPIFSRNFGAAPWEIGILMAVYSAMQFLFAPTWGRWSDRFGRRPMLLLSTAGAAVAYALFALGAAFAGRTALLIFLVSRIFAGICGANITVAQAYIADITPPEKRSQGMGLIGMAFGLGFVFGPAIGGLSLRFFGLQGPGWVAAAICAANFFLALAVLAESRRPDAAAPPAPRRPRLSQWRATLARPRVGLLILVFFLATFCFTCFETTLGLLVADNFRLQLNEESGARRIAYLYAYCGILGAVVQGGAIGRLVQRLGEPMVIFLSLLLLAVSLTLLPFARQWPLLLVVLGVLSIGSSLTRPPLFGMISNLTDASAQGATLGIAQSAGSLARIIGPIFAATLFGIQPAIPYAVCGGISLLAAILVWQRLGGESRAEGRLSTASPLSGVEGRGSIVDRQPPSSGS